MSETNPPADRETEQTASPDTDTSLHKDEDGEDMASQAPTTEYEEPSKSTGRNHTNVGIDSK